MKVDKLRSPYERVGGMFHFGRMLDKIRLHQQDLLPEDYRPNLGKGFDARCVRFLGVSYEALAERTKAGGTDEELLAWCHKQGTTPEDESIAVWNAFMRKLGWNDEATPTLRRRLAEGGFSNRHDIQTIFDLLDLDEGRDPATRTRNPWE